MSGRNAIGIHRYLAVSAFRHATAMGTAMIAATLKAPDLPGPRMLLVLGRRGQSLALDKSGRGQGGQAAYQDVPGEDVDRERVFRVQAEQAAGERDQRNGEQQRESPLCQPFAVPGDHAGLPTGFRSASVLGYQGSRQPSGHVAWQHPRRAQMLDPVRGISERFRYGL